MEREELRGAGVTLRAVATSLGIAVESGRVRAEGELDFRGASPSTTERYCVVFQTLSTPPELSASIATGR